MKKIRLARFTFSIFTFASAICLRLENDLPSSLSVFGRGWKLKWGKRLSIICIYTIFHPHFSCFMFFLCFIESRKSWEMRSISKRSFLFCHSCILVFLKETCVCIKEIDMISFPITKDTQSQSNHHLLSVHF